MKTHKTETIGEAFVWARRELAKTPTPYLDAQILLAYVAKIKKDRVLIESDKTLSATDRKKFEVLIGKRKERIPVAYLTGQKEFFGLDFLVSPKVLIPRPATERIVEKVIEIAANKNIKKIVEVGTGSGAIAISLARHLPKIKIFAGDISSAALAVAAKNVEKHRVLGRLTLVKSTLLKKLPIAELVVANLPYLSEKIRLEPELGHEPKQALFDGSSDGLELYRQLFEQVGHAIVVIELGAKQFSPMQKWLQKRFGMNCKIEPIEDIDGTICGLVGTIS